jgi:hypothetical protein
MGMEKNRSVATLCPTYVTRHLPLAIMGVRLRVRHKSV